MLSEISFAHIRDNFWIGYYGPFQVVIDKSNGFINAAKMCSSGGKDFKDWYRLKGTHNLIHALDQVMALENTHGHLTDSNLTLRDSSEQICSEVSPPCKLIQTSNNNPTEQLISGTYCHPDLVPHIACWVSPSFALKVGRIINYFIVEEWRFKLHASELLTAQLQQHLRTTQDVVASTQALQASESPFLRGFIGKYVSTHTSYAVIIMSNRHIVCVGSCLAL